MVDSEKTKIFTRNYKGTFEELVSDIDGYIYFYNNEHFQEHNNGLAPL
ncbi:MULTISPECIES: IS3 family transposase [Streptococcus]